MASIDIDIDDILYSLAGYEKQELADQLYDDGYCPKQVGNVRKLLGNKWRLSKEDEETILRIANKIV